MALPERIGRYEVQRVLGEGAMGRVLLARDSVLGRTVAIKVLREDLGLPPDARERLTERLRREARAASVLAHPGIVTLHDMGDDPQVGPFLVFERIDGPTLRERLSKGPPQPGEVGAIARTLGAALTYAHAAGVVHGDVKPENVMPGRTGAKLTDLGVARLADDKGAPVLPTPAYAAPEAISKGAYSAFSDQYSLAATLYEALTGVRPFEADRGLSVTSRVLFHRALAEHARDRFPSCEAFATLLADELEGRNDKPLVTPLPPSSIVPRATRRWQNSAALAGVAVILALLLAGRLHC